MTWVLACLSNHELQLMKFRADLAKLFEIEAFYLKLDSAKMEFLSVSARDIRSHRRLSVFKS
jgi:hypothetical protein